MKKIRDLLGCPDRALVHDTYDVNYNMAEMCLTDLNQVFTIRLACTSQISIDIL